MTVLAISHASNIAGPLVDNPLTLEELSILLALPRAAKSSPDSLFARLPKGLTPSDGYVDVSYSQACSIVARLALSWSTRTNVRLGPGTTVCITTDPHIHGLFHHFAFWALGCTVQYVTGVLGDGVLDAQLDQSGCKLIVYAGKTTAWIAERREKHSEIEMAALDESEHASILAYKEKIGLFDPPPAWPVPKRPSPALIIQSSSSTSMPKLMSFSLYFYTLGLPFSCHQHLAARPHCSSSCLKRPQTHPRLLSLDPTWQSFHELLLSHLITATPFTLLPTSAVSEHELATWLKDLDVGGIATSPARVCAIIFNNTYTKLLQSMYSISMSGATVDEQLSDMISQKRLNAANILGMSKLGLLMTGNQPPYTRLRPCPDFPCPLALPISDSPTCDFKVDSSKYESSREVELWYLVSRCPQLGHVALRGGVPLKLEPFPGTGAHKGEIALNLGDVFYEVHSGEQGDDDVAYIHAGRTDDHLRLVDCKLDISALQYEFELRVLLESRLAVGGEWRFDAAQLFGSNLPKTALVVQLLGDPKSQVNNTVVEAIQECVEQANNQLIHEARVDPIKRMLITTRVVGGNVSGSGHRLISQTHKQTLRRWQNVKVFGDWLSGLDWE